MMLHIPQVLNAQQLAQIRAALERADWTDGTATVGAQGAKVKHNRQLPEQSPTAMALGKIVQAALHKHPLFFAATLPKKISPPLFNAYAGGEHYGLHVDGAVRALPDGQASMRTDVSSTLFLSAPQDYDGGQLVVFDTYGSHEVKLPAGDLIVYPASSLHRVEAVTRGLRLCSFFWTQSMVRQDAQRSMLFELDQHISAVRSKLGDTPEVLGLTAHYHNLLRQWVEP